VNIVTLTDLFSQYGYFVLLIGSFGEGLPIMLFGGFAAHRGWLVLIPSVILVGAVGNAVAQGVWFFGFRMAGSKILEKRADWAVSVDRVNALLERWEAPVVIGARFIPGMSSAALIAIALSRISSKRFMVLNIVGAVIWAISLGLTGYLIGNTVEHFLGEIESYEKPIAVGLLLAAAVWIAWSHAPRWGFMRRRSV
jgi:membrane protein DedA with SNARE-associated domain